jgi:spore coat protein U-like protein
MRRSLIVLAGFAVVSIAAEGRVSAQQASSSNLTVSASVTKNCTITTAPVNFGAYDPVAANATASLDGLGTVTIICTKGAEAKIGLGPGNNFQGTRRMAAGATEYLGYELYKDTAHATVWGDTIDTALDIPAAPDLTPRDFPVYGQVPGAQNAAVGNYTDSVVATVNF